MKSARINFGVPNSEYVLLANDNGEATSLKNQDTGTEYIGGGGDFTTAKLTLNYSGEYIISVANIIDIGDNSGSCGLGESGTFDIILYKGKAYLNWDPNDNLTINSGAAEIIEPGSVLITGDCTITVTA